MPTAVDSRRLGPYELVSLIGSGGMGEVYRARDTRLNRDVAVKIVSGNYEEEARAISALNHPNIVTIHDAGVENGSSYIVTELIEGRSLRDELRKGALPLRKTLDYGVQIAAGLAEAHEQGIVHRDLKPENIMITRDGRVKILDFGIAHRDEEYDSARTLGGANDQQGQLLGTTAYMSPEQARGGRVSHYTDQFALGLLLYEMATGDAAFKRDTPLATLSAILTEDAPELPVGSELFQWIVKRCLHKEPDHRYASTRDLLRELENVRAQLGDTAPQAPRLGTLSRVRQWPWLLIGTVAAAMLSGYLAGRSATPAAVLSSTTFSPVVSSEALEISPAWSPSGRSIAYAADVDGVFQIFVRSTGGTATQLTHAPVDCRDPFWSSDGTRLFFHSGGAMWAVSPTGGSPVKLMDGVEKAAVAPDGNRIAVVRRDEGRDSYGIWLGSLGERSKLVKLESPAFVDRAHLRFSPDGTKLAAWVAKPDSRSELLVFPAEGGSGKTRLKALSQSPHAREFSWMPDSDSIVYSDDGHLFRAHLPSGHIEQITNGTGSEWSPSVSPDGRSIVFASAQMHYDLVRIGFDGSMRKLPGSDRQETSPTVSRAGDLAFVTDRNGSPEVWLNDRAIVTPDSFGEDRTTSLFDLAFSPDGRRLAYTRTGGSDEAIWISTVAGDPPVRLAKEPGDAFQRGASWSPDGNSLVYHSMRRGRYVLVRASAAGVERPTVIAENAGTYPKWAPRGDAIATLASSGGLHLIKADGSEQRTVGSGTWLVHAWSDDGSVVHGVKRHQGKLVLASVRASDGSESVIADLGAPPAALKFAEWSGALPLRGFSMHANGFTTSIVRGGSDLWVVELH